MSFDNTGKNFIEMMQGKTTFLFINGLFTVTFFGLSMRAFSNYILEIGSYLEWEKGLVYGTLFMICMVGFIDEEEISFKVKITYLTYFLFWLFSFLLFTLIATLNFV